MKARQTSRFRRAAAGFAVAALATIGGVAAAGTAEAAPWNCPISGSGNSRSTLCWSGSGQYRVAIFCVEWHGASGQTVYGPWITMGTGTPSVAWCSWTQHVGSAWAQTR